MTRKIAFFEGWSWFKFDNLGLALGANLKFCSSVAKGLKLKVRKFWGPNPTFVELTKEKLVGGLFAPPLPPILNRVNILQKPHIWEKSGSQVMAKNAVDQCDFSIKMRFSEKILFPGKQAILALKIAHPHNFGSAVGFF